jgi:hypothetical protein
MDLTVFDSFCSHTFAPSSFIQKSYLIPASSPPPPTPLSYWISQTMAISLPWPFLRSPNSDPPTSPLRRSPSTLLHYYSTPGIPPPSARQDPSMMKPRETERIRFWHVWRYALIAASKGLQISLVLRNLVAH